MKCQTCGHDPEHIQQKRAAVSRWSGMTKKERSEEMSRIRRKGIKKPKRVARRSVIYRKMRNITLDATDDR